MEEFVIGLVPQASRLSMGHWFHNMTHLPDHQMVTALPIVIKAAAAVLMTLAFDAWKKGFGENLKTHCEANKN